MKPLHSPRERLLLALLLPIAATFVQWLLWDYIDPFTWFLYYPAAFTAALVGGWRGGIMATLTSVLLGIFLFIPPQWSFHVENVSALASAGMFTIMGIVFSLFHERFRALSQKAARRESEERLGAFMTAIPGHAWMKDAQGRYAYANRLLQREVMAGRDDYQGLTDCDFFPRDIADMLRENDQAVLSKGQPLSFFEDTRNPDGTTRHWHSAKFPFEDAGKKRYVGGIAIDITQQKQAEDGLRMAKASLELVLSCID
jgi:two-component system, sensor histidine kinase and response regulator